MKCKANHMIKATKPLSFLVLCTLLTSVVVGQEIRNESIEQRLIHAEKQLQVYKAKLDSMISAQYELEKSIEQLSSNAFYPKFHRIKIDPYTKFSSGFMTIDKEAHSGLFTGAIEIIGVQVNYNIKRELGNLLVPADVSPFFSFGWGPMLVADNIIYNYCYLNGGLSINQFSSVVSYGGVFAFNTSGDEATQYVYGVTVSLDGIQTPIFASLLWGDKGFEYMGVLGLKIPLTHLIPHRSERF